MTESAHCHDPEVGRLLGAYEVGELSPPERQTFERHLADCVTCQEDLYGMAEYTVAMRSEPGRVLQTLASDPALADRPLAPPGRPVLATLRRWLVGPDAWRWLVPIGAAALVAMTFMLPRSDYRSPLGQLAVLEPLPYVAIETRSLGGWELFTAGMSAYADGRYQEAAEQLRAALQDDHAFEVAQADQTRLYLGIALLLDGDTRAATAILERAVNSSVRAISERSRWYLAQASLVDDEAAIARRYLTTLLESPVYGREASSQLRELERLSHQE